MKSIMMIMALGVLVIVSGCQTKGPTPYQALGEGDISGGYWHDHIGTDRFVISFKGTHQTKKSDIEKYLQQRAQKVTTSAGYESFVMIDGGMHRKGKIESSTRHDSFEVRDGRRHHTFDSDRKRQYNDGFSDMTQVNAYGQLEDRSGDTSLPIFNCPKNEYYITIKCENRVVFR